MPSDSIHLVVNRFLVAATFFFFASPNSTIGADCNNNGVEDSLDIDGTDPDGNGDVSADCDNDAIPDECQLLDNDCNENGIPDDCDVSGTVITSSVQAPVSRFGGSVDQDGNKIIVGETILSDGAFIGYVVNIYSGTDHGWLLETNYALPGSQGNEGFGYSVSICGDSAIVGAPRANGITNSAGAAYVLRNTNGNWQVESILTASDGTTGDRFGFDVCMSGDIALVGAPRDRNPVLENGSVYCFRRVDGVWIQEQKIFPAGPMSRRFFGSAISISNNMAIIGAPQEAVGFTAAAGAAYVFAYQDLEWQERQKIFASDPIGNMLFGHSIDMDGDSAIIGAPGIPILGPLAGRAYQFERVDDNWHETSKLVASDGVIDNYFGVSVSIDHDVIAIGASWDDDLGTGGGSAYLFRRFSSGWRPARKVWPRELTFGGELGSAVSVQGDRLLAGAPTDFNSNGTYGRVYVVQIDVTDCNENGIPDDCDLSGDYDGNGLVDVTDISAFVKEIIIGPICSNSDMNLDGAVDGRDIETFLGSLL